MDTVTQQNAALVEEAAAAAGALQDQAESLKQAVSVFRLNNQGGAAPHSASVTRLQPRSQPRIAAAKPSPVRTGARAANGGDWEEF
ncbi:methyl-accepting chemotaxis protein, partial [Pseudoduganella sp. RAF53_2]